MVIGPGHDLHLGTVGEERAGGHIELPQFHRDGPFPAAVILASPAPGLRLNQPVTDQRPVHRGAGYPAMTAAFHLEHQPPRTPLRMRPPQLTDRFLDLSRDTPGMIMDLVAPVLQPRDAILPGAQQPRVHALAATPYRSATSVTGTPAPTSKTARYLCSVTLNSHSMSESVKHQAEPRCQASSGTAQLHAGHPVTTDRKIICRKWARCSGPGLCAMLGPGQG